MKKIIGLLLICATSSLMAANGALIYKQCSKCHGIHGKHKAFGKSSRIAGAEVKQTIAILQIFKHMSNVDKFAKVMNKQVEKLSSTDIKAVAEYISTLK